MTWAVSPKRLMSSKTINLTFYGEVYAMPRWELDIMRFIFVWRSAKSIGGASIPCTWSFGFFYNPSLPEMEDLYLSGCPFRIYHNFRLREGSDLMSTAAPPIKSIEVLPQAVLAIDFRVLGLRYVDLKTFPLLGKAKRLLSDADFLTSFVLVDGVPEWDGQSLLGPEDLLRNSVLHRHL